MLIPIHPSITRLGQSFFKDRYNIGFWAWELTKLSPYWNFAFDFFDEIWTPSNYSAEAISAVSPIPVFKVPHSMDLPQADLVRADLGLPEDKFIFLFMFDFHSTLGRKNPLATIDAFRQAFGDRNEEVLLVLKHSNAEHHPEKMQQFLSHIGDCASVHLIEGHLRKQELHALINSCDCYISLHRSEGFGLTMAEAMYYGKPVIATGYSSTLEFMNVGNSYLVEYDLITANETDGSYPKGSVWADPSVDHAAKLMQQVFGDRDAAKLVGERARQEIRALLSPNVLGQKIKKRLKYIYEIPQNPNWKNRMQRLNRDFAIVTSENANQLPTFETGLVRHSENLQNKRRYFEFKALAWEKTANKISAELAEFKLKVNKAKQFQVPIDVIKHEESIEYCYRLLFGQEPTHEEISYWLKRIDAQNMALKEVVEEFICSTKFREYYLSNLSNCQIETDSQAKYLYYCYYLLLDREPDSQGIAHWNELIQQNGMNLKSLLTQFIQSSEFEDKKTRATFFP